MTTTVGVAIVTKHRSIRSIDSADGLDRVCHVIGNGAVGRLRNLVRVAVADLGMGSDCGHYESLRRPHRESLDLPAEESGGRAGCASGATMRSKAILVQNV